MSWLLDTTCKNSARWYIKKRIPVYRKISIISWAVRYSMSISNRYFDIFNISLMGWCLRAYEEIWSVLGLGRILKYPLNWSKKKLTWKMALKQCVHVYVLLRFTAESWNSVTNWFYCGWPWKRTRISGQVSSSSMSLFVVILFCNMFIDLFVECPFHA